MLSQYKHYLDPKLTALARRLYWINPNGLTLLGLIPPVLFFAFMRSEEFLLATVMLFLLPLDMLDGAIARANNKVTKFGGFLDSTLDRVSDFFIAAGLYAGGLVRLEVVAILLLAMFLISYTRLRAEAASNNTIDFAYGLMERSERIIGIFIILVVQTLFPNTNIADIQLSELLITILTLLCVFTATQRIVRAYRLL